MSQSIYEPVGALRTAQDDLRLDCDVLLAPGADPRMVAYTATTETTDAGKLDLLRVTFGRATGFASQRVADEVSRS